MITKSRSTSGATRRVTQKKSPLRSSPIPKGTESTGSISLNGKHPANIGRGSNSPNFDRKNSGCGDRVSARGTRGFSGMKAVVDSLNEDIAYGKACADVEREKEMQAKEEKRQAAAKKVVQARIFLRERIKNLDKSAVVPGKSTMGFAVFVMMVAYTFKMGSFVGDYISYPIGLYGIYLIFCALKNSTIVMIRVKFDGFFEQGVDLDIDMRPDLNSQQDIRNQPLYCWVKVNMFVKNVPIEKRLLVEAETIMQVLAPATINSDSLIAMTNIEQAVKRMSTVNIDRSLIFCGQNVAVNNICVATLLYHMINQEIGIPNFRDAISG